MNRTASPTFCLTSSRQPEPLEPGGHHGHLGAPLQIEFREDPGHVVLDGLLGEEHLRGDLAVPHPSSDTIGGDAAIVWTVPLSTPAVISRKRDGAAIVCVPVVERVSRGEVIAFRLASQNLTERVGAGHLLDAAGRCGIQNSPPGSALAALHARVQNLTSEQFTKAIAEDKSLIQTWCMRGAPFYVPTADAAVFTTGVLPPTETTMRHFIRGVNESLDRLGINVTNAVALTGAEIGEVLAGNRLAINEIGEQVAARIAERLPDTQRTVWEQDGPYAPGQSLGEGVVHFCIRILTLQGVVCFAPRAANKSPLVLVDEWLGHPIADVDPDVSRAELLRRHLHCHGPTTRADFAAWVGIAAGDTDPWWSLLRDELTAVQFGGTAWMLTDDLATLRSASMPTGVRLLPPGDPYIRTRDRDTIVDEPRQRDVWKAVGAPGTILADGEIAGIWRSRKKGRTLTVTVSAFGSLSDSHRIQLRGEADQIGALRGASTVEIEFDGG